MEAARSRFPSILLSVDANSAYSLERDRGLLQRLDVFELDLADCGPMVAVIA